MISSLTCKFEVLFSLFRAYQPTGRKRIHSENLKRKFHIGLQSNSKVSSGAFGLAMLAFWEGTISDKDIHAIYKTGKKCLHNSAI